MAPCVKCQTGFIDVGLDDVKCLMCGFRPPLVPKKIQYREAGSQCTCGSPGDLDGGVCKVCRYTGHAEKIRRGMAQTRLCRFVLGDGQICAVQCPQGNYFYCDAHRRRKRVRTRTVGAHLPVVQEAR